MIAKAFARSRGRHRNDMVAGPYQGVGGVLMRVQVFNAATCQRQNDPGI